MSPNVIENLVAATEDVFRTMVFRELSRKDPVDGDALRPGSNVVGAIGFAGSESGLVASYSTLDAAREITGALVGLEPCDVNGEIADAIGEVTTMIAGSFRTRMATPGDAWAISIPTVTMAPTSTSSRWSTGGAS